MLDPIVEKRRMDIGGNLNLMVETELTNFAARAIGFFGVFILPFVPMLLIIWLVVQLSRRVR